MKKENTELGYLNWRTEKIPTFEYDDFLFEEDAPYRVTIDEEKYVNMLRDLGMTEERIGLLTIRVKKREFLGIVNGSYDSRRRRITIYTDPIWKQYRKYTDKVSKIIHGKRGLFNNLLDSNPFPNLHTSRLPEYLKQAPPERAREFSNYILRYAAERESSSTAAHEANHAAELQTKRQIIFQRLTWFAIYTPFVLGMNSESLVKSYNSGIIRRILETTYTNPPNQIQFGPEDWLSSVALSATYYLLANSFNPLEQKANKFANMIMKDPEWHQVVKFEPKDNLR